ncbi:EAL domain-containing protein [Metabacillus iocasae]|uniref:Diguanylate cyclase (GGDEF)-like protein/PAS domain S-box-containing protein n=1 Tax=Priestia iocasae TaxID=2291674 RepID=A0ABS2QS15_9BACI|nr:EAL domain-containing protein [Metabacillus iocasae]MBM7702251.1 diguanylate cyclase (GGDEF)-like protein/PAS domain S-box-containing protein [Metabacillus iocasae]
MYEQIVKEAYSFPLHFLSLGIGVSVIFISFFFIDQFKKQTTKSKRHAWMLGASIIYSVGIWGIQQLSIEAFQLSNTYIHHTLHMVLALLGAIIGNYLAFWIVYTGKRNMLTFLGGGMFMSVGFLVMFSTCLIEVESVQFMFENPFQLLALTFALLASFMFLWISFQAIFYQRNYQLLIKFIYACMITFSIFSLQYIVLLVTDESKQLWLEDPIILASIFSVFALFTFVLMAIAMLMNRHIREHRSLKGAIFTSLLDPMVITNEEGYILEMNKVGYEWFTREVIGKSMTTLFPDYSTLQAVVGQRIERMLTFRDKTKKWIELTVTKLEAEGVNEYLVYMRDVTEQKEFGMDLQEVNNRYQQLFNSSPLPIVVHRAGNIVSVNQETLRIVGVDKKEEAVGRTVFDFFQKEERTYIRQLITDMINSKHLSDVVREIKILNDKGEQLTLETKSSVIFIKGKTYIQTILKDITDYKKAKEAVLHTTYEDPLTGLPNASFFHTVAKNRMMRANKEGLSLGIMVVDLDRFRYFNDTYGRAFGDHIVKEIAKRIQQVLSPSDLLSSFGTDGFLLMIKNGDKEVIRTLGKTILSVIQQPFTFNEVEVFLSASVGVSVYSQNSVTLDTLIRQAEMAMYHTKKNGRNNMTFYDPSIQQADTRRMVMEDNLHRAVANDEFELYYQPKIHVKTGKIAAVEALIRWNHPVLGQISPAEFIPIAEETGLIVPMSEWVLHTACMQNKRWQEEGMSPMRVAVNISSVEFGEDDFVTKVVNILEETKLSPHYLELEITESVAIKNVGSVIEKLDALKQVGVYISIDDFGSGYSSLSYIKKLPIDALKVDRSFIQDLKANQTEETIVKAIITIAKSLQLDVVAEGVEEQEQVQILRKERCDEIQGYYFSKPLPVSEFEQKYESIERHAMSS